MKKLLYTAFVAMLLLTACDPAEQYPISYKYNGNTWYAASAGASITNTNKFYVDALPTVQNQRHTVFVFTDYATPGTYALTDTSNIIMYTNDGVLANSHYTHRHNPATLIITSFDSGAKKLTGEFHGYLFNQALTDSLLITDGKFNLKYN